MVGKCRGGVADPRENLHLVEYVLEVLIGLLDGVCVGSFIRRHHHAFIPRQPLNLLLHIAPLVCAPVVTPAYNNQLVSLLPVKY